LDRFCGGEDTSLLLLLSPFSSSSLFASSLLSAAILRLLLFLPAAPVAFLRPFFLPLLSAAAALTPLLFRFFPGVFRLKRSILSGLLREFRVLLVLRDDELADDAFFFCCFVFFCAAPLTCFLAAAFRLACRAAVLFLREPVVVVVAEAERVCGRRSATNTRVVCFRGAAELGRVLRLLLVVTALIFFLGAADVVDLDRVPLLLPARVAILRVEEGPSDFGGWVLAVFLVLLRTTFFLGALLAVRLLEAFFLGAATLLDRAPVSFAGREGSPLAERDLVCETFFRARTCRCCSLFLSVEERGRERLALCEDCLAVIEALPPLFRLRTDLRAVILEDRRG